MQNSEIFDSLSTFDLKKIRRYQHVTKPSKLDHIPGGSGFPLLGHVPWILKDFHGWAKKNYKVHGPVFRAKTPLLDTAMLLGPKANSLVFKNEDNIFSNFLAWDNTFRGLFDNNLLERDFGDHKAQRKIMQKAFKRPALEGHIEIMNPSIRSGIDQWPQGKRIKAMDQTKQLLLDTGARVFLGLEMGQQSKIINQAFVEIVAATADPFRRKEIWFSPYAKGLRANQLLCKYIMDNIPSRRNKQDQDMFTQLCNIVDEDGNLLPDEVIRDHIIFLLFAAHDTSTSVLSSVLYLLASNQKWQDELRNEMFNLGVSDLRLEHIDSLAKTGLTIKEALRMYPPLAVLPRYALEDFEFNGHLIPANTVVIVSSLFTHYMPEYWSDPYKFDPYRFSPGRGEDKKDFFQYVPFGGGAHKCIGLHFAEIQGKIFLFHLLKNYQVKKGLTMTHYKHNNIPLTFPTNGLPLSFYKI
ncbi:cytochrome P450 [Spongiibacter marinus]|uniref:cytochrome P450 n=1 Tax=Spongiibacter marinus TaxID=354246 RepID=UPI0035BE43FA